MHLKRFKQADVATVALSWTDGHESVISTQTLRDSCPCAGCKGETVLMVTYVPPAVDKNTPGRYDLKGVTPVGNYAVKLMWGDAHDMGIYTWEHLRSVCECDLCVKLTRGGNGNS